MSIHSAMYCLNCLFPHTTLCICILYCEQLLYLILLLHFKYFGGCLIRVFFHCSITSIFIAIIVDQHCTCPTCRDYRIYLVKHCTSNSRRNECYNCRYKRRSYYLSFTGYTQILSTFALQGIDIMAQQTWNFLEFEVSLSSRRM